MSTRGWALVLIMAVTGSTVVASPSLAKYKVEEVKAGGIHSGCCEVEGPYSQNAATEGIHASGNLWRDGSFTSPPN